MIEKYLTLSTMSNGSHSWLAMNGRELADSNSAVEYVKSRIRQSMKYDSEAERPSGQIYVTNDDEQKSSKLLFMWAGDANDHGVCAENWYVDYLHSEIARAELSLDVLSYSRKKLNRNHLTISVVLKYTTWRYDLLWSSGCKSFRN